MTDPADDVIDHLVGVSHGSPLDAIRRMRVQARDNAQASYMALLHPADAGDVSPAERLAVAAFVTGLHADGTVADFYARALATHDSKLAGTVAAEIAAGAAHGPYGHYPAGPLSGEDSSGPEYAPAPDHAEALGRRLSAAFVHAHMLVLHPRDSSAAWLQRLLDAGWSTTAIVTLSQLVAFLSFQIRAVSGLRTLDGAMTAATGSAASAMAAAGN